MLKMSEIPTSFIDINEYRNNELLDTIKDFYDEYNNGYIIVLLEKIEIKGRIDIIYGAEITIEDDNIDVKCGIFQCIDAEEPANNVKDFDFLNENKKLYKYVDKSFKRNEVSKIETYIRNIETRHKNEDIRFLLKNIK
jgi:hypothetical protein